MAVITFEQLPEAVSQLFAKVEKIEDLLLQHNCKQTPGEDQFLTIEQACEFLKLERQTIYGLVSSAKIPCMKKGKRLYFSKNELSAWIKTGRKRTIAEIKSGL
ncbi:MAG: helix-turn-helix domain-containing protein [Chitinophagaceae bacterium]|nr:helix-turn-helix domain-containing protein [Chitinophagaceae bacterium]